MKRSCALLTAALILCSLLGGCTEQKAGQYSALANIAAAQPAQAQRLHQYDSPYTVCYENPDQTYSMYIFSSPVQFQSGEEYREIDNTLVAAKAKGKLYENEAGMVSSAFPADLSGTFRTAEGTRFIEIAYDGPKELFSPGERQQYVNLYGTPVDAVVYQSEAADLYFYSVKSGIRLEAAIKQPEAAAMRFFVITDATECQVVPNGYLLFKKAGANEALVYAPVTNGVGDAGDLSFESSMDAKKQKGGYLVELQPDPDACRDATPQTPVTTDLSFELYLNKMPDSGAYEKYTANSYLRSYAAVGNHPVLGESWHYLRLRLNHFVSIDEKSLIEAKYVDQVLTTHGDGGMMQVLQMDQDWSSVQLTWDGRMVPADPPKQLQAASAQGNFTIDITELAKACYASGSGTLGSYGLLLKPAQDCQDYTILASADSSVHTPYIELHLRKLPRVFEPRQNINPT